jgi:hypothetical protein
MNEGVNLNIEKLKRRHSKLKAAVVKAQQTDGFCSRKLAEMKKKKLRIKDDLTRASRSLSADRVGG